MSTRTRRSHAGRTLTIFLLITVILYVIMATSGHWTPRLGLDLRGGTSITLTAKPVKGETVSATSLEQARTIIQQRVNSMGVGESSVKTMGNRNIVVAAPNVESEKLVDMVGQTAQLGFRNVYDQQAVAPQPTPSKAPNGAIVPSTAPMAPTAAASPSAGATASAGASASGTASPSASPTPSSQSARAKAAQQWKPSKEDLAAFASHTCGSEVDASPDKPLVTCTQDGTAKYLLSPLVLPGTMVTDAIAKTPTNGLGYEVDLTFDAEGRKAFGEATTYLCSQQDPRNEFAIVLDGKVVSSPRLDGAKGAGCPITGGQAQITGNFTQDSASQLANVLKYGALPLALDVSSVDTISPTLGGEQLRAGIIAGIIGLILVAGYCLLYYRGLGLVVIGSLAVAGAVTYASMVLLGPAVGFTLSLAGIAGAIVAIGITADSFIVYFERIRDEIRDGRTLRTALDTGWRKARGTIMMADGVSLLSAIVLFVLSVDQVKGFAFTLGLTTVIDLFICFFFTHPAVTLLGRTNFWGRGRPGSGLEAAHMGVTEDALLGRRARASRRPTRPAHHEEA